MANPKPVPEDLRQLAEAHGVATHYRDGHRRPVAVDADVVVRVLALLEVDAATAADRRRELAAAARRRASEVPPPTVAARTGRGRPLPGARQLVGSDGARRDVRDRVPEDLAPGWYECLGSGPGGSETHTTLVVAPPKLPEAPLTWGWMLQLYALHSAASWGVGDLGDLREFLAWTSATHGAGAVLLNPLHAPGPTHPVQPSPYTPSSRRFANPLALRIEDTDAYRRADPAVRAEVDALRVAAPGTDGSARIDYDLVWAAKRAALELLWRDSGDAPLGARGRGAGAGTPSSVEAMPTGLREFATWCALAERHGGRWSRWPAPLRDPASFSVAAARAELAPRVAFHAWVQHQCAAQLASVRTEVRKLGMPLGVVHDLAVGVDPEGADAWALADVLAGGVSVGAPPDEFTPRGQNWGLPPWRPDRLAATGYAALRDMLRAVLAHADGLRIDHVAGLWRLWWVPPGESPDRGSYVHYDAEVMLAVLALEAHRAGAVVVGEDLGTVEPEVTEALAEQEMLGCAVSWFARDQDAPGTPLLAPERWPQRAAASLSTHDLPTAAGFLRDDQVRARAELGLLDDLPAALAAAEAERGELLALLRAQQLLPGPADGAEPDERSIILAMHRLLARTPCRLQLVSPYDVLAEPRQPNLPGTLDEYPNWKLPLSTTLERLRTDPRVGEVAAEFAGRAQRAGTAPAAQPPA